MTLPEIVSLALRMRDTLRNGLERAWRYLMVLGLPFEFRRWVLLGA